jgi:hypothetical protein
VNARALRITALVIGVVASVAGIVLGLVRGAAAFFQGYLIAYELWTGVAVGALAIVLLQFLTGGAWGLATRRIGEAAAFTLLPLAVLFVPLAFGIPYLYPWADPTTVSADPVLQHKAPYLNVPFFVVRGAIYVVCWSVLALLVGRWSAEQDASDDPRILQRLQRLSVVGLLVLAFTVTFAAIDWLMSLEPHWYSTGFPAAIALGHVLAAFAFAVLVVVLVAPRTSPRLLNDLGSLLLAFVMLWAYLEYFQYMLIWAGNLSEEIPYYLARIDGAWQWLALFVALAGFALPFALLVLRPTKRSRRALGSVAVLILVSHAADVYWQVAPGLQAPAPSLILVAALLILGMGGFWIALFGWRLGVRPLVPRFDPRAERTLELVGELA